MRFEFSDKESYLAWRQAWKANYAELSQEIRDLKRRRKLFLRTYERYENPPYGWLKRLIAKVPNPHHGECWKLGSLRDQATFELERLKEARALSWQLREARLRGETLPTPAIPEPVIPNDPVPVKEEPSLLSRIRRWAS